MSISSAHPRLLVLAAALILALLVAACGDSHPPIAALAPTSASASGTSTGAGSAATPPALASSGHQSTGSKLQAAAQYANCLRSHGLSDYPDPKQTPVPAGGYIISVPLPNTDSGLSENAPQVLRAASSCAAQRGAAFGPPTAAELAHLQKQADAITGCMHDHGFGGYEDPILNSLGVEKEQTPTSTLDQPGFRSTFEICSRESLAS